MSDETRSSLTKLRFEVCSVCPNRWRKDSQSSDCHSLAMRAGRSLACLVHSRTIVQITLTFGTLFAVTGVSSARCALSITVGPNNRNETGFTAGSCKGQTRPSVED